MSRPSWVEVLKDSLPDYASDLKANLDVVTVNGLTEIDSHICAMAAAIACDNGGLAYEIQMSPVLIGNPIREDISSIVSSTTMQNYIDNAEAYISISKMNNIYTNTYNHASKEHVYMIKFVTNVIQRNQVGMNQCMNRLITEANFDHEDIWDIIKIAAVISAVGKIAL